jgi:hypothetical protein
VCREPNSVCGVIYGIVLKRVSMEWGKKIVEVLDCFLEFVEYYLNLFGSRGYFFFNLDRGSVKYQLRHSVGYPTFF